MFWFGVIRHSRSFSSFLLCLIFMLNVLASLPCDTVIPTIIFKNSSHETIHQDIDLQKDTERLSLGTEIYVSVGSFVIILADIIATGGSFSFNNEKAQLHVSNTHVSSVHSLCYNSSSLILYTPNKCRNEKLRSNRSKQLFLNAGNGYDIRLLKLRDPKHKHTGRGIIKWESITWSPLFDHKNGLHSTSIRISEPGQYNIQVNLN